MNKNKTTYERFFEKVRKTPHCWIFTGYTPKGHYGRFRFFSDFNETAHRVSYLLHYGFIPRGRYVLHRCGKKTCVNPSHLYAGTPSDNMFDRIRQQRGLIWENNGRSKLTKNRVDIIRKLYKDGFSSKKISIFFGVCKSNILSIVKHRSWKTYKSYFRS